MTLGSKLRTLRLSRGISIKKLAPELSLNYTYLSKLENDKVIPSEAVIERISRYYGYDRDELMLLADRIPDDIRQILRENPQAALEYLRNRFARDAGSGNTR